VSTWGPSTRRPRIAHRTTSLYDPHTAQNVLGNDTVTETTAAAVAAAVVVVVVILVTVIVVVQRWTEGTQEVGHSVSCWHCSLTGIRSHWEPRSVHSTIVSLPKCDYSYIAYLKFVQILHDLVSVHLVERFALWQLLVLGSQGVIGEWQTHWCGPTWLSRRCSDQLSIEVIAVITNDKGVPANS